jgi:glycosyltransferase involved in cell wall biosynthesis
MITYNHERFIAQAIESVLMQKVNFDYEIIIGEDHSTDKTRAIVIDYQQRFPERIKTLLPSSNLGAFRNFWPCLCTARGEYVIVLEGDDYWITMDKLQKQVDILDAYPNIAVCFHNALEFYDDKQKETYLYCPDNLKTISKLEDLFEVNFVPTCSALFRNRQIKRLPDWFGTVVAGDWSLHILNAQAGDLYYINEAMCAHRIHAGGFWHGQSTIWQCLEIIKTSHVFHDHFSANPHYQYMIRKAAARHCRMIVDEYMKQGNTTSANEFIVRASTIQAGDFNKGLSGIEEAQESSADQKYQCVSVEKWQNSPEVYEREFNEWLTAVRPLTTLDDEAMYILYREARIICEQDLPGNFVQAYEYSDGSSLLLAQVIQKYSIRPRHLIIPCNGLNFKNAQLEQSGLKYIIKYVDGLVSSNALSRNWLGMISLVHVGAHYNAPQFISLIDSLHGQLVDNVRAVIDGACDTSRLAALNRLALTHWAPVIVKIARSCCLVENLKNVIPNPKIEESLKDDFLSDDPVSLGIESQMSPNERFQLYFTIRRLLSNRSRLLRFIEIGSHAGGSFYQICKALQRMGLPFQGIAVEPDGQPHFYQVIKQFCNNAIHLPVYSHDAAKRLSSILDPENLPEFILVDGDHSYQGVRQDIIDYYPLLAPGGIIMFHDYLPPLDDHNRDFIYAHHANTEPGIRQACQEMMELTYQLEPLPLPLLYPNDPTQTQAHLPIVPEVYSTVRAYRKPLEKSNTQNVCRHFELFVTNKGDIFPCCMVWGDEGMKIGNVCDQDIKVKLADTSPAACRCPLFNASKVSTQIVGSITSLNIELSLLCQAQCAMCCVGAPDWKGTYNLYERLSTLVEQCKPEWIIVQGGEVLIQKDSLKWIEQMKNTHNHLHFGVVTNGNIDRNSYELIAHLFDFYIFSFVGFQPETYRKIMGINIEKSLDLVQNIISREMKKVYLKFLITPSNLHEVDLFFKWAVDMRPDRICISDASTVSYINRDTKDGFWDKIIARTSKNLMTEMINSEENIRKSNISVFLSPSAADLFNISNQDLNRVGISNMIEIVQC